MRKLAFVVIAGGLLIAAWSLFAQQFTRINITAYAASAPTNIVAVSTTPTAIFSSNTSLDQGRVLMRTVQNVGTVAVLYSINSTNVSSSAYHGVIAAGSVARDGIGSVLDLARVPFPIYVATESGTSSVVAVELTQ